MDLSHDAPETGNTVPLSINDAVSFAVEFLEDEFGIEIPEENRNPIGLLSTLATVGKPLVETFEIEDVYALMGGETAEDVALKASIPLLVFAQMDFTAPLADIKTAAQMALIKVQVEKSGKYIQNFQESYDAMNAGGVFDKIQQRPVFERAKSSLDSLLGMQAILKVISEEQYVEFSKSLGGFLPRRMAALSEELDTRTDGEASRNIYRFLKSQDREELEDIAYANAKKSQKLMPLFLEAMTPAFIGLTSADINKAALDISEKITAENVETLAKGILALAKNAVDCAEKKDFSDMFNHPDIVAMGEFLKELIQEVEDQIVENGLTMSPEHVGQYIRLNQESEINKAAGRVRSPQAIEKYGL